MTATETTRTNHRYFRVLAILAALAVVASSLISAAKPAEAAFPGQNGKIFFESHQDGPFEIYSVHPDGSAQE